MLLSGLGSYRANPRHVKPWSVKSRSMRASRPGDRNAVLVDRDTRFEECIAAIAGNAADVDRRIVRRLILDLQAWREAGEVLELLHAELLELSAGESAEREGDVDLALLAQLGGDDDDLLRLVVGRWGCRSRLSLGKRWRSGDQQAAGCEQ